MLYHILLKPDVFWRNNYSIILDKLLDYNIKIYYCSLIYISDELLDAMYMDDFQWKYDYYMHNRKLYSLGPSLSLICDLSSCKLDIKNLKGSALPKKNNDLSIRKLINIKDRVINSIHIADNQEKSLQEIKIILKIDNFYPEIICNSNKNISKQDILLFIQNCWNLEILDADYILKNILFRIENKLCFTLGYYLNELNSNRVIKRIDKDYIEIKKHYKINLTLDKLIYMFLKLKQEFSELKYNYKFMDLFFSTCSKNNIYIYEIEKYVIVSNILYKNVNIVNVEPKVHKS